MNMSFMLTKAQVRRREKDVTRRLGWKRMRPGLEFRAVERCQGLAKGEKQLLLAPRLRCVSTRWERLDAIDEADVVREGFAGMRTADFVEFFCNNHRDATGAQVTPGHLVNRIEFEYLELPAIMVLVGPCPRCDRASNPAHGGSCCPLCEGGSGAHTRECRWPLDEDVLFDPDMKRGTSYWISASERKVIKHALGLDSKHYPFRNYYVPQKYNGPGELWSLCHAGLMKVNDLVSPSELSFTVTPRGQRVVWR